MMLEQDKEKIFSYTFTLRKKFVDLPIVLSTMQVLKDRGLNCFLEVTAEMMSKNKPRWLKIHIYERSSTNSTITFSRLLASVATDEDKKAISNINFAFSHDAELMFSCSFDRTKIIVDVFSDNSKKGTILEYFNLNM